MKLVSLLAAATLAASLSAQNCSTLTVSGGAPNTNLAFSLTGGDAMSPVVIVIGDTVGTTTLNFGTASLVLSLAQPFAPIGGGFTNARGRSHRQHPDPASHHADGPARSGSDGGPRRSADDV